MYVLFVNVILFCIQSNMLIPIRIAKIESISFVIGKLCIAKDYIVVFFADHTSYTVKNNSSYIVICYSISFCYLVFIFCSTYS